MKYYPFKVEDFVFGRGDDDGVPESLTQLLVDLGEFLCCTCFPVAVVFLFFFIIIVRFAVLIAFIAPPTPRRH